MKVDVLVVGAGFAGSVMAERLASVHGKKVLVVERRNHIGGNAFDGLDDHGVLVQRYGPHIFHTPSSEVWSYVNRFSSWLPYQHHVIGLVDDRLVPVPFNLNSMETLLPPTLARRLEFKLLQRYGFGRKVPILELRQAEDPDLSFLADFVYEKVFLFYTAKAWEKRLEELSPAAAARVPVFVSRDDRYFQDRYQGIPSHGYTRLFENMLDHPGIRLMLNTDYRDVRHEIQAERVIYTGPIDACFDYRHGKLKYRSIRFEWEHHAVDRYQVNSVVNYPCDYSYTRCTEYKHFTAQRCAGTTISREYPYWAESEADVPYYPMPDAECAEAYARYEELARSHPELTFFGRLAQYRYYDMDDVVEAALNLSAAWGADRA